jgi:hypothetical protein
LGKHQQRCALEGGARGHDGQSAPLAPNVRRPMENDEAVSHSPPPFDHMPTGKGVALARDIVVCMEFLKIKDKVRQHGGASLA